MSLMRTAVENPEAGTPEESPFRRLLCRRFPISVSTAGLRMSEGSSPSLTTVAVHGVG
jgi:hypothetical protein